jgi:hypothetical protein
MEKHIVVRFDQNQAILDQDMAKNGGTARKIRHDCRPLKEESRRILKK